jgi:hypothetical protein
MRRAAYLKQHARRVTGEKLAVSNISAQHGIRRMPGLLANFPG